MSIGTASSIATGRVHRNVGGPLTKRVKIDPARRVEYRSWVAMIDRCCNSKSQHFARYGGAEPSVTVYPLWRESFTAFLRYMGPRPSGCDGGIDRWPDKNGGYVPGNVRWATQQEQMENRRDNRYVAYKGRKVLLKQLARDKKISYDVLYYRIKTKGWDVVRAITEPLIGREQGLAKGRAVRAAKASREKSV